MREIRRHVLIQSLFCVSYGSTASQLLHWHCCIDRDDGSAARTVPWNIHRASVAFSLHTRRASCHHCLAIACSWSSPLLLSSSCTRVLDNLERRKPCNTNLPQLHQTVVSYLNERVDNSSESHCNTESMDKSHTTCRTHEQTNSIRRNPIGKYRKISPVVV